MTSVAIVKYLLIGFVVISFASCKKVIDVDLGDAEPRIVIEGNISDQSGWGGVLISRSVPFGETNIYPRVHGAIVSIENQLGKIFTFHETDSGTYVSDSNFRGISGNTYTLTVKIDGTIYSGSSKIPNASFISGLDQDKDPISGKPIVGVTYAHLSTGYFYSRFIEIVNGVEQKDIFLDLDPGNRSGEIRTVLYSEKNDLKKGDVVEVLMENIDKNMYDYFRSLAQISGQEGALLTTPTNPVSNIKGGALGYFNACTFSSSGITIQ